MKIYSINTLKNVDRVAHATCFLIVLKSAKLIPTQLEAHEKFVLVWKNPEDIIKNWEARNENKDHDHWIYFFNKSIERLKELGYVK